MPKKEKYNLEKDIKHLQTRRKKAAEKLKPKSKPAVKEDWATRLKRNVQMLLKGKDYQASKKKTTGDASKMSDAKLKKHGMSDADIKRMRATKKKKSSSHNSSSRAGGY
jgi:hypothetical protein